MFAFKRIRKNVCQGPRHLPLFKFSQRANDCSIVEAKVESEEIMLFIEDQYKSRIDNNAPATYESDKRLLHKFDDWILTLDRFKHSITTLHWAIKEDRMDVFQACLRVYGITEVNRQTNFGTTPLHTCVEHGVRRREMMECLVAHGADFNIKDTNGDTPIDLAVKRGYRRTAVLLRELQLSHLRTSLQVQSQ